MNKSLTEAKVAVAIEGFDFVYGIKTEYGKALATRGERHHVTQLAYVSYLHDSEQEC